MKVYAKSVVTNANGYKRLIHIIILPYDYHHEGMPGLSPSILDDIQCPYRDDESKSLLVRQN